jgi:SAM dependent carboxyl methyltransferase
MINVWYALILNMTENWINRFGRVGTDIISKALEGKNKIAEMTSGQGTYSEHFLKLLPGGVELYRTDFPIQEYNKMSLVELPFNVYLVPGSIYKQLHPGDSLDLIYAFQVFNQLSTLVYAPDHLLSTLSRNPKVIQMLDHQQNSDLSYLLEQRYKELKIGGDILFDILMPPETSPDPYSWDCLDLAVQVLKKEFPQNQSKRLNLHTYFRNSLQIKSVLESLKHKFVLRDIQEQMVLMPAYENYTEDHDIDTYVNSLIDFWRYPVTIMILRVFKNSLTVGQINSYIDQIMQKFKEICLDLHPKTMQKIMFIRLTKI